MKSYIKLLFENKNDCDCLVAWSEPGLGIPVVLVVVEGGTDAIKDARKSLHQKTPVVLCEGTGRAADIMAYAFKHRITTRK